MKAQSRTVELVGALSLATDLGAGLAPESALRTAIIAARLARTASLDPDTARDAYYAGLLRFLGCTGYAHEQALINAGDDLGFLRTYADVDLGDPRQVVGRTFSRLARPAGLANRVAAIARFLGDPRNAARVSTAHCAAAVLLARKLGMSPGVTRALDQMYERWDGRGAPARLGGGAVDPVARLLHVAHVAEVFSRIGGEAAARAEIRRRRGRHFEPRLADAFRDAAGTILEGLSAPSAWDLLLDSEPWPVLMLAPADAGSIALAFAHYADLKSPFMLGHSLRVAELVAQAGAAAGLAADEIETIGIAALLHDIGRVSVPAGIWDKPGPLNDAERDRIHGHSAETERVLRRSVLLTPLAGIAAAAYERLDGSGHHRGVGRDALPKPARLLAACDVHVALTSERPWRPALSPAKAAALLAEEVRLGRLGRDAVRAVCDAAGVKPPSLRRALPDGLSEREAEVLALLARGLSNRAIGERLHVSPRTVQSHVMHIFEKTGIRGRAAAALYAVDKGLAQNQHFGG
jgi:HD-GYP domain-containing protein (c-di-GMP phosphodiesterase class II)